MEIDKMPPVVQSLADFDFTSTPDLDEPMIDDTNVSIEPIDNDSESASPIPESLSLEPSKNQNEISDLTNTLDLDKLMVDDHNVSIEPMDQDSKSEASKNENKTHDLTNTPDLDELIDDDNVKVKIISGSGSGSIFETRSKPISNEIIATPSQKDLAISKVETGRNLSEETETCQNVSETIVSKRDPGSKSIKIIPNSMASKELLEKLDRGQEKVETLGYIDASALDLQNTTKSKKAPLKMICEDEFLPDIELDSIEEAPDDIIANQESVPTDSDQSKTVLDDHDYLQWSMRSLPIMPNNGIKKCISFHKSMLHSVEIL